ncbi:MAG: sugar phosphate isomerase/epimerase family protein [Candidatus Brocadiia bacterium]
MAIACSTSAFKGSLETALAEVSDLGFECVDLIAIEAWNHIVPAELADDWDAVAGRVTSLLVEHDLTPVAMNVALPHLHQRDGQTNAERLRLARAVARLLNHLDVGLASFYPGVKVQDRPWEDVLADTAATWEEMMGVAEGAGVTFAVELHYNTPFETIEQCRRLFEAAPEMRIAYDPSHFVMQGMDVRDTAPLLDRAVHVHLRDAADDAMQVPTGEGNVDFGWLLDAFAERGYEGHYSIEYLSGRELDVRSNIARLKSLLEERLSD